MADMLLPYWHDQADTMAREAEMYVARHEFSIQRGAAILAAETDCYLLMASNRPRFTDSLGIEWEWSGKGWTVVLLPGEEDDPPPRG